MNTCKNQKNNKELNILILNAGTRNKIVEYFKREFMGFGKIFVADNYELAPTMYVADGSFLIPKVTNKDYINVILNICIENDIKAIFSLIDTELELLSKNKRLFLDNNILPIVSNYEMTSLSFDKFRFYKFLKKHNFSIIKTYNCLESFYQDEERRNISFPVFVKPRKGSASINASPVNSKEELKLLSSRNKDLIIQELMDEKEYGVDVYIDLLTKETAGIFIKEKLKMRAGETDKSVSILNEQIFDLVEKFIEITNYEGMIDIDIFEKNNQLYISEVNPRFGGGYPHAYECGINIPKMILNNLLNISNPKKRIIYKQGVYMMKYSEILIKENI